MLWISDQWKDYEVLDASDGERLERWGKYILVRPDPQVIWSTPHSNPMWKKQDARYIRSSTGVDTGRTIICRSAGRSSTGTI